MSLLYDEQVTVKEIKIRVYKWKETLIKEEFADCGLLQGCIINEIMHVKQRNNDFLQASTDCTIAYLEPIMDYLPCSYECSFETWCRLCLTWLLAGGESPLDPTMATELSETIGSYLVSNYHAVQDTRRDYKIVVAINIYMKTIIDESPETGPKFPFSEDGVVIGEILCGNNYGVDQTEIISPIVPDVLLEIEEKVGYFNEFLGNNRNSLLNLWPSSGYEWTIRECILEWLVKENLLHKNPEIESWFQEVKPALMIKKYDAGCSKNSEDRCAICLEEICEGDAVAVTPCSHIFHCTAILGWLKENMTCPMCRRICLVHI